LVDELVDEGLHDFVQRDLEAGGVFDEGENELLVAAQGGVVEAAVRASVAGGGAAAEAVGLEVLAAWGLAGIYQAVNGQGVGPPFGALESTSFTRNSVEYGRRLAVDGRWSLVVGRWRAVAVEDGRRLAVDGPRSLVVGGQWSKVRTVGS
jgi:hypothetical protein